MVRNNDTPADTAKPGSASGSAAGGSPGNAPEYSVSEIAGAIKRTLEDGFSYVRVRGELGRISRPASGHIYCDLKDDRAVLAGVIWKGVAGRLKVRPEEGMEVIAQGRITTFPGSSKYQIVIESLEPAGVGALMALLEARKAQLGKEGLFDEARKQLLPFLPRVVGIITSPSGAVIRDMIAGFTERFPTRVIVWPVRVQGETCAGEVAAAIRGFNAMKPGGPVPRPDVLIVARGGGSLEDLWGFNEEIVVRAAAESELPLISAVGHETDWTLIDLAADARAPTPTKAAEWAVPMFSDLVDQTEKLELRLKTSVRRVLEGARTHLKASARGLPRREDLLALPRQRFDSAERNLGRALLANTRAHGMRQARITSRLSPRLLTNRISRAGDGLAALVGKGREALLRLSSQQRRRLDQSAGRLRPAPLRQRIGNSSDRLVSLDVRRMTAMAAVTERRRRQLDGQAGLLRTLSYQGVLSRGFALVRGASGAMLRRAGDVEAGMGLDIEFSDGRVAAVAGGRIAGGSGPGPGPRAGSGSGADKSERVASQSAASGSKASAAPRPPQKTADPGAKGEPVRPAPAAGRKKAPEQGSLF